jgi:hypothetical protein
MKINSWFQTLALLSAKKGSIYLTDITGGRVQKSVDYATDKKPIPKSSRTQPNYYRYTG